MKESLLAARGSAWVKGVTPKNLFSFEPPLFQVFVEIVLIQVLYCGINRRF